MIIINIPLVLFMAKFLEKIKACQLRKAGKSIKEIAKKLRVSKSTVSLWCSDIRLSRKHINALHEKMVKGGYKGRLKGAETQKRRRLEKIGNYQQEGFDRIGRITSRDVLLFGLGLYLGEGNKGGNHFQFVNSSPGVIRAVMQWLKIFGVTKNDFYCNIIINEIHRHRIGVVEKRWRHITGFSPAQIKKTILIRSVSKKVYENSDDYLGTLILRVYKSSDLLYKVLGLIHGLLRKMDESLPG